jgi:hypothetical protein
MSDASSASACLLEQFWKSMGSKDSICMLRLGQYESGPSMKNRNTCGTTPYKCFMETKHKRSHSDEQVKMYAGVRRCVRWITPEHVQALMAGLLPHQQDLTLFALATSLRRSNVHKLSEAQLDLTISQLCATLPHNTMH